MKKIAAFILACVMLVMGAPVLAGQNGTIGVQASVTDETTGAIQIVFTVPEGFSDKEMAVYVFNPKAGDENGYSVADIKLLNPTENAKILQYYTQKTVSDTTVTVDLMLNQPVLTEGTKPKYNIYAALDNSNYGKGEVFFYDNQTKLGLLTSINNNTASTATLAEDVKDVFVLGAFDVSEIVTDSVQFAGNIMKLADTTAATKENIETIYKQAAILTAAKEGKTSIMLQNKDTYKGIIGIADTYLNELANIKSSGLDAINNSVKNDYADIGAYCTALQNAILTAEIYHYKDDGSGHFTTLMSSFRTDFETLGVDFTAYDKSDKLEVAKDVIAEGFVEPTSLAAKINYYSGINVSISNNNNNFGVETGGSYIGGGNGGGGGGGAGSGSGAIKVPTATTTPDIPKAEPTIFSDLDGAEWAESYILRLYEAGIVNGDGNGRFLPHNNVSRREFVKMIAEAFAIEQGGDNVSFADVNAKDWAYDYIMRAASNGIVMGFGGEFSPSDNITRQDLAVMLVRCLKLKDKLPSAADKHASFGDAETIAAYAQESVGILWQSGVIGGNDVGNFMPHSFATRAETAKMICGVLDMIQN